MAGLHETIDGHDPDGAHSGTIEVDWYDIGERDIFIEAIDLSGEARPVRSVVIVTSAEARQLADILIRAARASEEAFE